MNKNIKVSAPGKLMLFGEHAVVYGRPCIVTSVDARLEVSITTTMDKTVEIQAPDVGVKKLISEVDSLKKTDRPPKEVQFLLSAIRNFYKRYGLPSGVRIKTKAGFSSKYGFGSSAAVTVGVLYGLSKLFKKNLGKKDLFTLGYKSILDVQGVGSGFDLAAAIWGGTLYFVTGGQEIVPLKLLNLPLVVGYTGVKADTPSLVKMVGDLRTRNPETVEKIFETIANIALEARKLIREGDIKALGELMNINQGLLESLGVGTRRIANLVFAAREAGAWGAKLSGAGGGDCMIALADEAKRSRVERAIKEARGKVLKIEINAQGVRIEK